MFKAIVLVNGDSFFMHMGEASAQPHQTVLQDGEIVIIRPIRPEDAALLQAGYRQLSSQSMYQRFLGYAKELTDREAAHLANVDYKALMALVATTSGDEDGRIVGVARYERSTANAPGCADCAIVVGDRYQRQGLGSMLLRYLAAYAQAQGVHTFVGTILASNSGIMHFIEDSGLTHRVYHAAGGSMEVHIGLDASSEH